MTTSPTPPEVPTAAVPKIVGVVGGGRMGAGIAQVFAVAGAVVCLVEQDRAAAIASRDRVAMGLHRAAEKGKLTESPDTVLERAHALLDRMARSGALALRLTKLVTDAPGGHPLTDDLAQAILFESDDKRTRMDAFLSGDRR